MNLSKINYFLKAAEYRNFTRAAAECYIAQTTMSKYIAELESELGFSLFERKLKSVILTRDGQRFYDGIRAIYKEYQQLVSEIQNGQRREIHIGMMTREYAWFPVLSAFEQRENGGQLYFAYGEESEILRDYLTGQIDCLICSEYTDFEELSREETVRLCLNKTKEALIYSRQLEIEFGNLAEVIRHVPLITKSDDVSFHQSCRERLKEFTGAEFETVTVAKEFHEQMLLVNMSKGFAIVPAGKAYVGEDVKTLLLPDAFDEITHIVFHKDNRNPALHELIRNIEGMDSKT